MVTRNDIKKSVMQLTCLVLVSIFSGCAGTVNEETVSQPAPPPANVLQVGVTPTAPPLIFYQDNGVVGLETEFAGALAKSLGKTVRFIMLGWDDLIPALLEKRIDIIMSGMSVTKMREARISFTSPYLKAGQMALVRNQDAAMYPSTASIKNTQARVGFMKGTTGSFLVQQELQLTTRKISFGLIKDAIQALVEERIDLFIDDAPVIWHKATTQEAQGLTPIPILLTEESLAWGVRRDNTQLLEAANLFLETWKSDGKLKTAITKWMPYAPVQSIPD
jgi:polar amino acid transport system substrate-binding protein